MKQRFEDFGIKVPHNATGDVKVVCPECSHRRTKRGDACLSVNIDKGVWNCHHCGWTGGLMEERPAKAAKAYVRPNYVARAGELPPNVLAWFAKRGITPPVLLRNQIGVGNAWFPQTGKEQSAVSFPYLRGNQVVNVKWRTADKLFRMEKGAELCLYGLNDIAETTVWVEGEMDKLALEVAGFPNAVSVPNGAPAPDARSYSSRFDFIDTPELERVKTHIIAVDNDAPGTKLREELIRRLGPENCLVAEWPEGCKDANDVLMRCGADALAGCVRGAKPLPIVGAFDVDDFANAFDSLYDTRGRRGVTPGWADFDPLYSVRPGEWTLVTGIPGHGKSEFLDAMVIRLAEHHGWRFAYYSPENFPVEEHLVKLAEKRVGRPFYDGPRPRMSREEATGAREWLNEHVHFIYPDEPSVTAILAVAKQLVRRNGIRGIVIDPWNEVEHSRPQNMTETEYISQTLTVIRRFARDHGVHVWLVAHPQKLLKEKSGAYPVPTPYDVSGSAHWRNKADNCIAVWRDTDTKGRSSEVEVHVQKVRHKIVGRIGLAVLAYDYVTGRYSDLERATEGKSFRSRAVVEEEEQF